MVSISIIGCTMSNFPPYAQVMVEEMVKSLVERHQGDTIMSRGVEGAVDELVMRETLKRGKYDDVGHNIENRNKLADADIMYIVVSDEYPIGYNKRKRRRCHTCQDRNPWHIDSSCCYLGWLAKKREGVIVHWITLPDGANGKV